MATDALPCLIDQLEALPADTTELDFMIVSLGGDPMVAWRIMSLIRARGIGKVYVLIPQSAYSAATLLALGANEIVMHPNGHLGPVDMQIIAQSEGKSQQFSTEDISAFLEFVRERLLITDQRHLRRLFEKTCNEVGTLGLGFTSRSSRLAVALSERLLNMHMPEASEVSKKSLIESLSRQFHSHSYPVSRKEALELGLSVNKEQDSAMEALMWKLWLDIEEDLAERRPFHPVTELMNSPRAADVLSPPTPAPGGGVQPVPIGPVEFEYVTAIMESKRLAHRSRTKGVILASREPDMNLQFTTLVSFRGWERTHPN
jgi:hypothetical protein